ncbi:hypothetical protein ES703_36719 [subsurface metagenome]
MEEETIKSADTFSERVSIKLRKGVKRKYGWEIQIKGENSKGVLQDIEDTNKQLNEKYGGK